MCARDEEGLTRLRARSAGTTTVVIITVFCLRAYFWIVDYTPAIVSTGHSLFLAPLGERKKSLMQTKKRIRTQAGQPPGKRHSRQGGVSI